MKKWPRKNQGFPGSSTLMTRDSRSSTAPNLRYSQCINWEDKRNRFYGCYVKSKLLNCFHSSQCYALFTEYRFNLQFFSVY